MANWIRALRSENYVHQLTYDMEVTGWPFDKEKCEDVLWNVECKIEELSNIIDPHVPPIVKKYGVEVSKPFKKDGTHSKMVTDWYEDDSSCVGGPFIRVVFEKMNLASDKQLKGFLLSIGWVPDEWNFSKKTRERTSPKLTESSFDSIQDKWPYSKEIVEWLKLTHRASQLKGWLRDLRPDGRLPMIIANLTPTYRATHRCIVNVPGADAVCGNAMRACFIAEPGYKIVGIDSKSNQLRMLCHYMGDDGYTNAVVNGRKEDGTDIHTVNQKAAGLPKRGLAKNFIYGLLFGAQDPKIGSIVGGSAREGAALRSKFMKNLPAYGTMLAKITDFYDNHKYLVGLDGRKLRVRAMHMLLVYLLQGAEAVYMKYTLALIYKRATAAGLDFKMVGWVHDELQYMVKEEDVEEFGILALKAFVDAGVYLKLRVPMEGDLAVGDNWKETH